MKLAFRYTTDYKYSVRKKRCKKQKDRNNLIKYLIKAYNVIKSKSRMKLNH